jgi:type I restriction enzyme, S subunit
MEIATIPYGSILSNTSILKSNYHLNYGKKRIEKALRNKKPFEKLEDIVTDVYTGGIFKRVFIEDENFGLPYISAQHMMNADPLDVAKVISKKYTPRQHDMTLRQNQILVSCAGTVGNVRLITKDLDGVIGSQDIIRVLPNNDKISYGFIYAFLASPTAYNYIQSFIYGSVVPRISPAELGKLPIPIFPQEKQQKIGDLIIEASKLRVEANESLNSIIEEIESHYNKQPQESFYSVNIKDVLYGNKYTDEKRLESDYYQPSTKSLIKQIKQSNWAFLGDLSITISRSGLRERKFVENGIPLITGQNLNMGRLQGLKMLSKKFTRNIKKNTTKDGDILISVQGTIGRIEYVYQNMYKGVFASEQLSKVEINSEKIHPGYVYAFLKSKIGLKQLIKHKTGSVVEWIRENNIGSVVIPLPDDKGASMGKLVDNLTLKNKIAFEKENEAIQLIETELDLWQRS